jgi:outer membrane beta-barrel protein
MRRPLFLLFLLALPMLAPERAQAERRNPLEGQPAVRRRLLLRKYRLEFTPAFMTSINQDYKHAFGIAGDIRFYFTDWLGIGFQGAYLGNTNTGLEDETRSRLPMGNYVPVQPTQAIHDQRVLGINALMSAYGHITPFYGKIAFFSALFVNYDLYVNGGIGLVNYTQNCCAVQPQPPQQPIGDPNLEDPRIFAGLKVGGMIGVGAHIFFNEWLGMQVELRDYITKANPGGGDTNADRHLTSDDEGAQNNIFFGVGLTIMLPPSARQTK